MKRSTSGSRIDTASAAGIRWREGFRLRLSKRGVTGDTAITDAYGLVVTCVIALGKHSDRLPPGRLVCDVDESALGKLADVSLTPTEEARLLHAVLSLGSVPSESTDSWLLHAGGITIRLRLERTDGKNQPEGSSPQAEPAGAGGVAFDAERFRKKVDEELKDLPQEFEERRAALRSMHEVSRSTIAAAFEEALNRKAQGMPRVNYDDKKVVASWVNDELRNLGLALRCPRTGDPALLRANPGGANGRFVIEVSDASGKRHHTATSVELPIFRLRPDRLGRAPYGGRSK